MAVNKVFISIFFIDYLRIVGMTCNVFPTDFLDAPKHTEQKQLNIPLALWMSWSLSSSTLFSLSSFSALISDGVASFESLRFNFFSFDEALWAGKYGGGNGGLNGNLSGGGWTCAILADTLPFIGESVILWIGFSLSMNSY